MLAQPAGNEQFIGSVDVWQLRQMRWPIMRLFARRFVERRELEHYVDQLLGTGEWQAVRVAPAHEAPHIYDVYGTPRATAFLT